MLRVEPKQPAHYAVNVLTPVPNTPGADPGRPTGLLGLRHKSLAHRDHSPRPSHYNFNGFTRTAKGGYLKAWSYSCSTTVRFTTASL